MTRDQALRRLTKIDGEIRFLKWIVRMAKQNKIMHIIEALDDRIGTLKDAARKYRSRLKP
jgi:hypothetical protein